MSYVTTLIKNQQYKDLLLEHFPKPTFNIKNQNCFDGSGKLVNSNPSLTGKSFEIFFRIFGLKDSSGLENEFYWEYDCANKNISKLCKVEKKESATLFSSVVLIKQSKIDYKYKIDILKKILPVSNIVLHKKSGVRFIEITSKKIEYNSFKLSSKISKACGLEVTSYFYQGYNVILYDEDSLGLYYKKVVAEFREECRKFLINRTITNGLIKCILSFSVISTQFFPISNPIKNLKFEANYLSFLNFMFSAFNKKYKKIKDILITQPSLECYSILATPDHIVKDKILELKTSQRFFSNEDYLQGLSYLIFAQHPNNVKKYGQINSVEIYYCCFNQSVKIHIRDVPLNRRIKLEVKKVCELFLK